MKGQTFQTDRLIIRPLKEKDLPAVYELFSHDRLMETYGMNNLKTMDHARDFLEELIHDQEWAITLKETKEVIGTIGFVAYKDKHKRAEIAFELKESYWSLGYMKESLQIIIDTFFQTSKMNRLEAYVYPRNKACIHLLEGLGFTKEGLLRQYAVKRDKLEDYYLYSIIKSDYQT